MFQNHATFIINILTNTTSVLGFYVIKRQDLLMYPVEDEKLASLWLVYYSNRILWCFLFKFRLGEPLDEDYVW